MSAGHHASSVAEANLDRVLALPAIKRRLAKRPQVIRLFDVPYLGGYSSDGERVYLDRHLRPVKIKGRTVDPSRFIVRHEHIEQAIESVLGWKYQPSHALATLYEHRAVRRAGLDPKAYEASLKPFIKADARERLVRVPPDLDLQPYLDSRDTKLADHLKSAMNAPRPKLSKSEAHYGPGMPKTHCGNCRHYGNRDCEIVSGPINPANWCVYWDRKKTP